MVTQMLKNSVCKKHSTRQAHSTYIKFFNLQSRFQKEVLDRLKTFNMSKKQSTYKKHSTRKKIRPQKKIIQGL